MGLMGLLLVVMGANRGYYVDLLSQLITQAVGSPSVHASWRPGLRTTSEQESQRRACEAMRGFLNITAPFLGVFVVGIIIYLGLY